VAVARLCSRAEAGGGGVSRFHSPLPPVLASETNGQKTGKGDPRQLVFDKGRYVQTATGKAAAVMAFTASDGRVLRCQVAGKRNLRHCVLLSPSGQELASFDDVGLARLRGRWLANGQAVSLMQVE